MARLVGRPTASPIPRAVMNAFGGMIDFAQTKAPKFVIENMYIKCPNLRHEPTACSRSLRVDNERSKTDEREKVEVERLN